MATKQATAIKQVTAEMRPEPAVLFGTFTMADLTGANLTGTKLGNSNFDSSDLPGQPEQRGPDQHHVQRGHGHGEL